jgi:hypothetical protein
MPNLSPSMTDEEELKAYLKSYAGTHFDELVDADYDIIVADTFNRIAEYPIDLSDPWETALDTDGIHAIGILMFWLRELTIVVGDKDDYARAKENYELALLHADKYLEGFGEIRSIQLRGRRYHQLGYYSDQIDPLDPWNPVI